MKGRGRSNGRGPGAGRRPGLYTSDMIRLILLSLALVGCGREPARTQTDTNVFQMAREVEPKVEKAVGLDFKRQPAIALRSRAQVRSYLRAKLDHDFPPKVLDRVAEAYRLFHMIPDTLNLRALLLALYSEQVIGYYDPDSTTLYVVRDADPGQVRLILAHELVHALQGQYVPLDSILSSRGDDDRKTAAQAVMEGQATLASIEAIFPKQKPEDLPSFWDGMRAQVRAAQEQMPVFRSAPLVLREGIVFPYLAGADFIRWFDKTYPDTVPFGRRLPTSTEQILHPQRYKLGDEPVPVRIGGADSAYYGNDLGEFETRLLLTQLTGTETQGAAGALGWGGDRYAIYRARGHDAYALVWWSVWDTPQAAARFRSLLTRFWKTDSGRRSDISAATVDGRPAVRFVDAPTDWVGWGHLPTATIAAGTRKH